MIGFEAKGSALPGSNAAWVSQGEIGFFPVGAILKILIECCYNKNVKH